MSILKYLEKFQQAYKLKVWLHTKYYIFIKNFSIYQYYSIKNGALASTSNVPSPPLRAPLPPPNPPASPGPALAVIPSPTRALSTVTAPPPLRDRRRLHPTAAIQPSPRPPSTTTASPRNGMALSSSSIHDHRISKKWTATGHPRDGVLEAVNADM
jgi:hypothetical protein